MDKAKPTGRVMAHRYHDICAGHRVYGHESKCAHLHGHNYRFHFTIGADELDDIGRVLDFGVIKQRLAYWLEEAYDHKMLIWEHDPWLEPLQAMDPLGVIAVPYNPTAENIAQHMVEVVGPLMLKGTGTVLLRCRIEETRKCSASYEIESE